MLHWSSSNWRPSTHMVAMATVGCRGNWGWTHMPWRPTRPQSVAINFAKITLAQAASLSAFTIRHVCLHIKTKINVSGIYDCVVLLVAKIWLGNQHSPFRGWQHNFRQVASLSHLASHPSARAWLLSGTNHDTINTHSATLSFFLCVMANYDPFTVAYANPLVAAIFGNYFIGNMDNYLQELCTMDPVMQPEMDPVACTFGAWLLRSHDREPAGCAGIITIYYYNLLQFITISSHFITTYYY